MAIYKIKHFSSQAFFIVNYRPGRAVVIQGVKMGHSDGITAVVMLSGLEMNLRISCRVTSPAAKFA
jgi:hypothetical protein